MTMEHSSSAQPDYLGRLVRAGVTSEGVVRRTSGLPTSPSSYGKRLAIAFGLAALLGLSVLDGSPPFEADLNARAAGTARHDSDSDSDSVKPRGAGDIPDPSRLTSQLLLEYLQTVMAKR